jgi:hypothetical protein
MRHALIALALFGLSPSEPLAYRPSAGLRIERTFAGSFEMKLNDWNVVMNGQDVPETYLPKLAIESRTGVGATVRDEVRAARDGRLLTVRREYRELAGREVSEVSIDGARDASSGEVLATPSIAPCAVLFDETASDPDERRKLESGELGADALAALELDLDYTALLPLESGATWELDAATFNPFDPRLAGIEFHFEGRGDDHATPHDQLRQNVRGRWRLERGEERKEGERRLCAVRLAGEFETEASRRTELVDVPVASGAADERTRFALSVSGELVWDATHGVLHALEWSGEGVMSVRTVRVRDGSGTDTAYEHTLNFACGSKLSVDARVE